MNGEEVKKLYNALINKGYKTNNIGDEQTFIAKMGDKANRKELYDYVSSRGDFRIGDYDNYERRLTSEQQTGQSINTVPTINHSTSPAESSLSPEASAMIDELKAKIRDVKPVQQESSLQELVDRQREADKQSSRRLPQLRQEVARPDAIRQEQIILPVEHSDRNDEERDIDSRFKPRSISSIDDIYNNYRDRFSFTRRGQELGKELSDVQTKVNEKYADEFLKSDEYKALQEQYKGKELDEKANEAFRNAYSERIETEMRPYTKAYLSELDKRYGKQMEDDVFMFSKRKANEHLQALEEKVNYSLEENRKMIPPGGYRPFLTWTGRAGGVQVGENVYDSPNAEILNDDYRKLIAAKNLLRDSQAIVKEAKRKGSTSFMGGLGRGFSDTAFDADTWSQGLLSHIREGALLDAVQKADEGKPLTEAEQQLLDAAATNMAVQAYYSSDLGRGYKAGSTTGQSLGFMLQMAINPVSQSGSNIAKGILRYAMKRFGSSVAKRGVNRMAARLVGDALAATGVTSTTGIGNVRTGTLEREIGDVKFDMDNSGNINYAGRENQQSAGEALGKSFASSFLENQSEMVFNAFKGFGPVVWAQAERVLPGGVGSLMDDALTGKAVNFYHKLKSSPILVEAAKRTQFHGLLGEYMEEVYNNFANIPLGEMTLEEATDLDNNIDTFLGLAPTSVAFSLLGLGGLAHERYRYRRQKQRMLGQMTEEEREKMTKLEELSKERGNEDIKRFIKETITATNLTPEEKKQEIAYAYNIAVNNALDDVDKARKQEVRNNHDASFREGQAIYEEHDPTQMRQTVLRREVALERLKGMGIDEQSIQELSEIPVEEREEKLSTYTDDVRDAALDYLNALDREAGMNDAMDKAHAGEVEHARNLLEEITASSGNVTLVPLGKYGSKDAQWGVVVKGLDANGMPTQSNGALMVYPIQMDNNVPVFSSINEDSPLTVIPESMTDAMIVTPDDALRGMLSSYQQDADIQEGTPIAPQSSFPILDEAGAVQTVTVLGNDGAGNWILQMPDGSVSSPIADDVLRKRKRDAEVAPILQEYAAASQVQEEARQEVEEEESVAQQKGTTTPQSTAVPKPKVGDRFTVDGKTAVVKEIAPDGIIVDYVNEEGDITGADQLPISAYNEVKTASESTSSTEGWQTQNKATVNQEAVNNATVDDLMKTDRGYAEGYYNEHPEKVAEALAAPAQATADNINGKLSDRDYLIALGYSTGKNSWLDGSATDEEIAATAAENREKYLPYVTQPQVLPTSNEQTDSQEQSVQAEQTQQSAMERIPKDEQGQPIYEQADPDTAWDAIVEQAGGDEAMASSIVSDLVNERKKAYDAAAKNLKTVEAGKPQAKKGDGEPTMEERVEAKREARKILELARAEVERTRNAYDTWQRIAQVKQQREKAIREPKEDGQNEIRPAMSSNSQIAENSAIPVDKDGKPLYHTVPVDVTLADLNDGSLDANEVDAFIEENAKAARQLLEKTSEKSPKIGTDKAKYLADKQAWQARVDDARAQVDYWQQVADELAARRERPGDRTAAEILEMGEPMDGEELAAQMLANGSLPLLRESYLRETGAGNEEARSMLGLFASKEKGGLTIEQAGEKLMLADSENGTHFFDPNDANAGRDALISVLSVAKTRGDLINFIRNRRAEQARREQEAEREAYDSWCEANFHMSAEEYEAYENEFLPLVGESLLTEEQYVEFISIFGEELNRRNDETRRIDTENTSNEPGRAAGIPERSGTVLSEEETVPSGRIGTTETRPATAGTSVGTADGVVQGSASGIKRVNEVDENGRPFVLSPNGSTTFGEIRENSGLTPAPIKLSEGYQDKDGKGYGLIHIDANHGEQIRQAGFASVEDFVSYVATNYDEDNIRVGKRRYNGSPTFLIQVTDTHDNTLFIEMSKDGSYWNVNSAGIFRKGYANKKETVVKTEPQQPNNAVSTGSSLSENEGDGITSSEPNGEPTVSFHKNTDKSTVTQTIGEKVAQAEAETDTNPTDGQKEAGNYKKGHVRIGQFDITVENPKGSVRRGTDANGNPWQTTMHNTYGYIRGTEGVDGDHIDVFLTDDIDGWNGRRVYIVDQYNEDGTFDEHKVMLGFNDEADARDAYISNYSTGWADSRKIVMTSTNLEDFEKWIDSSHRKTKPFAEYRSIETPHFDNQGNPVNADGSLLAEKIETIEGLADEDFFHPKRNVQLPALPEKVDAAIGADGKPVVIKKNIFEKNRKSHKDLSPTQSREILSNALYHTDLYGQNQKAKRPYNWILIHNAAKHSAVILEVSHKKDNVEIVSWHYLNDGTLAQKERQAIEEGGLILTLESAAGNTLNDLSSGNKGTTSAADKQAKPNKRDNIQYSIEPTQYTTKRGKVLDMFFVKFVEPLTKEQQRAAKELAKAEKGWYDHEKGGFMMRSEESAQKLADTVLERTGNSENPLTLKPWAEMDAGERMSEADKSPLTRDEIANAPTDEVNKANAMDYLNGNHGLIQSISYLKVYEDVRNSTGSAAAAGGAADKAQLDETDTGSQQELGRGAGRPRGVASVPLGGGTGEKALPESGGHVHDSTHSEERPAADAGEGGRVDVSGEEQSVGGRTVRDRERGRSGHDSRDGRDGEPGRAGRGRESARNDGTRGTETQRGRNSRNGQSLDRELDDALKDFRSVLDEFKRAGKADMSLSLVGMNARQLEMLPRLVEAGAKVGYVLLRKGLRTFTEWASQMRKHIGENLQDAGLADNEVDAFIREMWKSKLPMNDETHTIEEWAAILGKKELRGKISATIEEKRKAQQAAESVEVVPADRENIAETLPFLLPQQQDDVLKAETQFFDESHNDRDHAFGKGYMFTNGTGTGKTYTGLGIVKRFIKQGKGRVLILTPSQTKVGDWIKDAANLGIELNDLDAVAKTLKNGATATTVKGEGAVITTYANFRQNKALLEDEFDLVVYDESHRLLENKGGIGTAGAMQHYKVSNRNPDYAYLRLQGNDPTWNAMNESMSRFNEKRDALIERLKKETGIGNELTLGQRVELPPVFNGGWTEEKKVRFPELSRLRDEVNELRAKYETEIKPMLEERAKESARRTKVVFLSATPFNTRENLDYAEGYIFSYPAENHGAQSPRSQFYLEHFGAGYRWRYHRLESSSVNPEAVSRQEVQFSDYLQNELQTMSGRIIDSPYDYSRDFPTVTLEKAEEFNDAMEELARDEATMHAYYAVMGDYNYTSALFESMKVSQIIPRMKRHIEKGRKVVVFHRRVESKNPIRPPFSLIFEQARKDLEAEYDADKREKKKRRIAALRKKYSAMLEWEAGLDLRMPREQLADAFGKEEVLFFSGKEGKKAKDKAVADFNDDGSGKNVIVIQEASGKEGISLHDTTGAHQRVLVTLALPQSPITALQIEGRIYRIGNKSNAIFEYPLLGLNAELMLFGQKFNQQVSTTENLALGSQARNLRESFARGVEEHGGDVDLDSQGVGGKEFDSPALAGNDPFDNAVLDYYTNQQLTGRRDNREGKDYYPTPEPLGYMMAQWGRIGEGESVLEPSAGHGAIARYVSRENPLTAIEPSQSLFGKLQLKAGGNGRTFENTVFEDYNVANKHDVVLMNPPFGSGGRLAVDHVAKAFRHLTEGGRLVAIIPRGAADKKFDQWHAGQKDAVLTGEIDLPDITFARAGTSVRCRVVVIDKVTNRDLASRALANAKHIDLSTREYGKMEDFFDDLRDLSMPERTIDMKARLKKKSAPAARELRSMKGIKDVELTDDRIRVSGRGVWETVEWGDKGGDALMDYLEKRFERFNRNQSYYAAREDVEREAVYEELKKLTCKLAGRTEDEMRRYLDSKPKGDVLYRKADEDLGEVNERFNSELERYQNGQMNKNDMFHLGNPNGVMRMFLPNLPVVMRQRIINKGSNRKHDVDVTALRDMPARISEPILVFKKNDGSVGILTEMKDRNGRNVFVAFDIASTIQDGGEYLEVNNVTTVHGRRVANIIRPILENNTLQWVDKEKALNWFSSASPDVQQEITNQELSFAANIVENFENPNLEGENISYREADNELNEVNERFNGLLDELTEENADSVTLSLGRPSTVLRAAGVEDKTMKLYGNKVMKKMRKHGFTLAELHDLPQAVADPIAVFKNYGKEGNRSILTELKTEQGNFLVTLTLGEGHDVDFNVVTSVFGKGESNIVDWIKRGFTTYINKEKALNYLHHSALKAVTSDNQELVSAANVVRNFENPNIEDENLRNGNSALTDDELSYENDPVAKMTGRSTRTAAQRRAFAIRERQRMVTAVQELAEKLHLDNVDIVTDASTLQEERAKAKGFYSRSTGRITIVIPNHTSVFDVEQTLLHEAVAHYGLRQLFGSHFNTFLDNVLRNADEAIQQKIVDLSKKHNWNIHTATEEYLASLAENTDFENINASWWQNIKELFLNMLHKIGFEDFSGVTLSDNELRYILWRSYENLAEPGRYRSILGTAVDTRKQYELGVGNFYNDGRRNEDEESSRVAEGGDTAVNIRFNTLLSTLTEENADRIALNLGRPSPILRAAGVEDKPMRLYGNKVIKKMKKHGFRPDELQDLPRAVANPMAVFNNYQTEGNRSILTNMTIGDKNVLVSVTVGKGNDVDFNIVSSVFGKGKSNIIDWINKGYATYLDKKKTLDYLHFSGSSIPEASNSREEKEPELLSNQSAQIAATEANTELSDTAKVVRNFKNPKVEAEEDDIFFRKGHKLSKPRRQDRDKLIKDYDAAVGKNNQIYNSRETFQDSMLSLKILMRLIAEYSGKPIRTFEDAYWAENRLSSINKEENKRYLDNFYNPLMDYVHELAQKYGLRNVEDYIYAKSGLERNGVLLLRDAKKAFDEGKKLLDDKLAAGTIDEDQYEVLMKVTQADFENTLATGRDYSGLEALVFRDYKDQLYDDVRNGKITEAERDKKEREIRKGYKENAERIVREFEEKAGQEAVDALWAKINAATNATLDKQLESGLIDQTKYEELKGMMKYYVPMRGWEEEIAEDYYDYETGNIKDRSGNVNQTAKGRTSMADNPLATIGLMAQNTILQGNRNKMKQRFFNFVINRRNPLAVIADTWYKRELDGSATPLYPDIDGETDPEKIRMKLDAFEEEMKSEEEKGFAFRGKVPFGMKLNVDKKQKKEHFVSLKRNGREYIIYINGDPRAAQALNGLTNPESSRAFRYFSTLNRYYGATLTSYNPNFMIPNAARDTLHASTMQYLEGGWEVLARYRKNLWKSQAAVFRGIQGKFDPKNPMDVYFKEFVENGGETGYTALHTIEDFKKDYARKMKEVQGLYGRTGKHFRNAWDGTARWFETVNRYFEDINRFNAYVSSRQAGKSIEESVTAAKNITVNFNKKGSMGAARGAWRYLGPIVSFWNLFLNPSIQSIYQVVKASMAHKRRAAKLMGVILLSGFLMPMFNEMMREIERALSGDDGDDDDKYDYFNQTDYTRMNNWLIYFPGVKTYVKIPLPPFFREIYGMGDILYRAVTGRMNPMRAGLETLRQLQNAVGIVKIVPEGEPGWKTALGTLVPDVAMPLYEIVANRDFMGNAIYNDASWTKDDPEYTRVYKGVAPAYVEFSRLLNILTTENHDDIQRSFLGQAINPAIMEHIVTSYTGGIGKTISDVTGIIGNVATGKGDDVETRSIPVINRFVQPVTDRTLSAAVNRVFYPLRDDYERLRRQERNYKRAIKETEDEAKRKDYREKLEEMQEDGQIEFIDYFDRKMKTLRKMEDRLKDNPGDKELEMQIREFKAGMIMKAKEILK